MPTNHKLPTTPLRRKERQSMVFQKNVNHKLKENRYGKHTSFPAPLPNNFVASSISPSASTLDIQDVLGSFTDTKTLYFKIIAQEVKNHGIRIHHDTPS